MSHERKIEYLINKRIIYRRSPITDKPTEIFEWGNYYEDGTYECYEIFRNSAKITTYKSLKWHLLVLWYLNPDLDQDSFLLLAKYIVEKDNGFVTFTISEHHMLNIIYEVNMHDLERPPRNKLRKIIFNEFTGLTASEKMSIVGKMIGKAKTINESDIYECMLEIHNEDRKITIKSISTYLKCSTRTIHRNMGNELKKEKELLNQQL